MVPVRGGSCWFAWNLVYVSLLGLGVRRVRTLFFALPQPSLIFMLSPDRGLQYNIDLYQIPVFCAAYPSAECPPVRSGGHQGSARGF